jgi:hypothetical protein
MVFHSYRCEAASLAGFIQQLAVSYVVHGYFFYVRGQVPEGKDPLAVDRKLVERYGIAISKWTRARRKGKGIAGVQYIRWRRVFVLIATHGEHSFFDEERANIRDLRRVPLKVGGYALSFRGGHAHVRIEREEYAKLKARFQERALCDRDHLLAREFGTLPFEPYAPVRRQLLGLLTAVNRIRKRAGLPMVPIEALRLRRTPVQPFGEGALVAVSPSMACVRVQPGAAECTAETG